MNKEAIIVANTLIAEFMGAKPCKDWQGFDGFEHEDWWHLQWSNRSQDNLELYSYRYSELCYNSSWDWLMPVIAKIEYMGFTVTIGTSYRKDGSLRTYCEIDTKESWDFEKLLSGIDDTPICEFDEKSAGESSKIAIVWRAVVEFAQRYLNKKIK